jgi:anti-anti-sigma regulatory factor
VLDLEAEGRILDLQGVDVVDCAGAAEGGGGDFAEA